MIRRIGSRWALLALAGLSLRCAPASPPATVGVSQTAARYFGSTTPVPGQVFRFHNQAEPEVIDPALATGQPDGRICRLLFEGLTREDAKTLEPRPGQAERWEISPDGLTYTFHLRPGLRWSDGAPLTAEDFRWSWLRVLNPTTAAKNSGLLSPIANADSFAKGKLQDASQVGVAAPDESTFVVRLHSPTAYFLFLTSYQTFMPTPRHAIEKYASLWTRPGHLVGNGAFRLDYWRQNERFELTPNPRYWDATNVKLQRVVAYTSEGIGLATNLYKAGMIDWNPSGGIPSPFLPYLKPFADYRQNPYQGMYWYSINVTHKPYDNVWVRRALNYAVDREAISRDLLKETKEPWGNFTPSGYPGYRHPAPLTFDPAKARECLARAGYPSGKGFPSVDILFNTSEDNRRIAEAIQAMWKRELNIRVTLSNQDWASYLKATRGLEYGVARRSWIGDYLDPNSFLAIFVTGDGNNRTGWSDPRYDALIHGAARERDATKRLAMLSEAEALLLSDGAAIPIYHYTATELVKPYVRGLYPTSLDLHPLTYVWIDRDWARHGPEPMASGAGSGAAAGAGAAGRNTP